MVTQIELGVKILADGADLLASEALPANPLIDGFGLKMAAPLRVS